MDYVLWRSLLIGSSVPWRCILLFPVAFLLIAAIISFSLDLLKKEFKSKKAFFGISLILLIFEIITLILILIYTKAKMPLTPTAITLIPLISILEIIINISLLLFCTSEIFNFKKLIKINTIIFILSSFCYLVLLFIPLFYNDNINVFLISIYIFRYLLFVISITTLMKLYKHD